MGWHRIALGIGNPGPEYEQTRHNAGFMVLDLLAQRLGLAFTRLERHSDDGSKKFGGKVKAQVCEGRRKGREFLLVKPQTYVNLSGDVAGPLLRAAGRQPDALFVIVDDLNLPLGPEAHPAVGECRRPQRPPVHPERSGHGRISPSPSRYRSGLGRRRDVARRWWDQRTAFEPSASEQLAGLRPGAIPPGGT
jgi:hypothetical protein